MELPVLFKEKMQRLLGTQYESFIESFNMPRRHGVRANTLKVSPKLLEDILGTKLLDISWCGDGFYYDYAEDNRLSKNPFYNAGLYYIQEPSAMSVVGVLEILPGERVLDLCASPGGKSVQAAGKLKNTGVLVSNDLNSKRIAPLVLNLELMGVRNAVVTSETPERLLGVFPSYFDKIIVDAPCSGEGMFRKDRDSVLAWDAGKSMRLSAIQKSILSCASKMLRAGGVMSYSTCSFAPEENEQVIHDFLEKNKNFSLQKIDHEKLELSKAVPEWADDDFRLTAAARIWPFIQNAEGHFVALLKKDEAGSEDNPQGENEFKTQFQEIKNSKQPKTDLTAYNSFVGENMKNPPVGDVSRSGGIIYMPPVGLPDISMLKTVRRGFFLGELKTSGRFEPSKALGLASERKDFYNSISLPKNSLELERFLRGESFDISAKDGYNLICIDDYPLNIVKVQGNRLKWRAGM